MKLSYFSLTEEDTIANLLKNANYDTNELENAESESQNKHETDPPEETQSTSQTPTGSLDIFRGLRFFITDFDNEQVTELQDQIQGALGNVTTELKNANYVVAPCFISKY